MMKDLRDMSEICMDAVNLEDRGYGRRIQDV
jgi:hypothetical protein